MVERIADGDMTVAVKHTFVMQNVECGDQLCEMDAELVILLSHCFVRRMTMVHANGDSQSELVSWRALYAFRSDHDFMHLARSAAQSICITSSMFQRCSITASSHLISEVGKRGEHDSSRVIRSLWEGNRVYGRGVCNCMMLNKYAR